MQAAQVRLAELPIERKQYLSSCYGFAKEYLRLPIYDAAEPVHVMDVRDSKGVLLYTVRKDDWQRRVLDAVDPHGSSTTLRTCNGAGKTSTILPAVVLWHMTMFPNSRVVITSGVDRQVKEQIFPALHAHAGKFRGWVFNDTRIEAPNGATCIGFSTDDGGKFEGWHGNKEELYALSPERRALLEDEFKRKLEEWAGMLDNPKGPLLIVVDEAKSVRKEIFDAIRRCTYQRLLLISSCGPAEGDFYDSHHGGAAEYTARFRVSAEQCPHADHGKNAKLIESRGKNDPLVKSKVFADFMTKPGDTVIDRATVDAVMLEAKRIAHRPGPSKVMCDFAGGGDENVIAVRDGNRITLPKCWREVDTMKACGEFIIEFRRLGLRPEDAPNVIYGDNDGLGKVIIDRMHELGWHINRVHNNAEPDREFAEHYVNRSAQVWWEGGKAIARREFILPADDILAGQLSTRRPEVASKGMLGVESKKKMRERGVSSPDRADAVLEAMKDEPKRAPIPFGGEHADLSLFEQMMQETSAAGFPVGACVE